MSTVAFERGQILFSQQRFDLAAAEFRRMLSEDPDNPFGHAFLALCLSRTGQKDESFREADEAVRLGPNQFFCHLVRGYGLLEADRAREAEDAARMAIELAPDDVRPRDLLARIELHRRQWARA